MREVVLKIGRLLGSYCLLLDQAFDSREMTGNEKRGRLGMTCKRPLARSATLHFKPFALVFNLEYLGLFLYEHTRTWT